jgi:hypothetical protein
LRDEVRILIFDDPAENESGQRPGMVRSGRAWSLQTRVAASRAMHDFFSSKIYEIPRAAAARV